MTEQDKLLDYLTTCIQLAKDRNKEAREFILDAHSELTQSDTELSRLQEEVEKRIK